MTTPADVIKVGVIGAGGRMGQAVCAAVRNAPDLELAATAGRGDSLDALAKIDVAVDFTTPQAVLGHVEWTLAHGIHTIVGTSGIGSAERDRIAVLAAAAPGVGVHIVPNFSIAAVLAMRLAAEAMPFFDDVEIVEYAGPHKLDAPAGTAEQTAWSLAAARTGPPPPSFPQETATTRGRLIHGVPVHSVRMAGLVSRQDVRLSREGELLTIGFETIDRGAFMPGVLMAIRQIASRPGLTIGLDSTVGHGGAQ